MEYRVDCVCGEHIMVREGAAGAKFTCKCGKLIQVPSLSELHKSAGVCSNISPEFMIENLLLAGELPSADSCSYCGDKTSDVLKIYIDCSHKPASDKWQDRISLMLTLLFAWATGFLFLAFARILFMSSRDADSPPPTVRAYTLPIRLCSSCQPAMNEFANVKRCFCKEPEYQRLLEKYPNARIELAL